MKLQQLMQQQKDDDTNFAMPEYITPIVSRKYKRNKKLRDVRIKAVRQWINEENLSFSEVGELLRIDKSWVKRIYDDNHNLFTTSKDIVEEVSNYYTNPDKTV